MRTFKKHLLLATASVPFALAWSAASAQTCPSLGASSDCSAVITITDKGSTVTFSGIGPYDSIEDTLVGVVNKSSQPIYAIGLNSITDIFGFDGDGITSYGAPGNAKDSTGYGGPNVYYSNIGAGAQSGVVNFVNPLAPGGGSTYLSLEEALTKPTAIQDIVNGSITVTLGGTGAGTAWGQANGFKPTDITGTFTPNGGITLAQATAQTGFASFAWQQSVTNLPGVSPFFQNGNPTALTAPPPFLDAPKGGYTYCNQPGYAACLTAYPFYPFTTTTATSLSMYDSPRNPNLPAGTAIGFKTELIGVLPSFVPGTDCLNLAIPTCVDLGVGFTWTSSYNGTQGGIAVTASYLPVDPATADGLGGVTLTGLFNTTSYSPFFVTTVNGISVPVLPPTGPIDLSQPYFLASQLGSSVNPDFEGGVLRMDEIGKTYSLAFTVGDPGGTIDAFGNQATFTGAFTDTSTVAPGTLNVVDSVGGGQITFDNAMGTADHPLGKLVNDANLVFGPDFVGYFGGVTNNGTLTNAGIVTDALVNTGILTNSGTYNADVSNLLAGSINNTGTWNGALLANTGLVANSGTWNGTMTNDASGLLMNAATGTITGLVTNNGNFTSGGVLGGGLTNSGAATVAGTINGAINNAGTLTLVGALAHDGSPITNQTAGVINIAANTLTGGGAIANAGQIRIGASLGNGTLNATSLTNSGTIAMQNGLTGDRVVLAGAYTGTAGSRITADVNMALNTAQSDRLVAASTAGTTTVSFANIGSKKIYFSNPIVIVQSAGGTGTFTAATDAQTSQALTSRGIVDFGFQKLASAGNNYGIVAKVNTTYASAIAGHVSADLNALNFNGFADGRQIDGLAFDGGKWRGQFWMRSIASTDTYDRVSSVSDTYSPVSSAQTRVRQGGVQVGADWVVWKSGQKSRLRLGVTGGYSEANSRDQLTGKLKAPFYGAYAIATVGGLMLDAQYERIDTTFTPSGGLVSGKLKGSIDRFAGGASLQGNIGIVTFEPFVRYAYAKLDLPVATLSAGEGTLAFGNLKSELVEGGVKLMHSVSVGTANVVPFFSAAYVEEMGNNAQTLFTPDGGASPVTISTRRDRGYTDLALGVTVRSKTSGLEAFIKGEGRSGGGDSGYGINAGARLRF